MYIVFLVPVYYTDVKKVGKMGVYFIKFKKYEIVWTMNPGLTPIQTLFLRFG